MEACGDAMSNYKLIKADDTELEISVSDIQPGAMSFNQRPFQGAGSELAVLVGTGVREATTFTVTIRIDATTRSAAMTTLATIHDFARDALYLAPADESTYRALQADGMSVVARDPTPINAIGKEWLARFVLNPRFPRSTLAKISTFTAYKTADYRTLAVASTGPVLGGGGGSGEYGSGTYGNGTYGG